MNKNFLKSTKLCTLLLAIILTIISISMIFSSFGMLVLQSGALNNIEGVNQADMNQITQSVSFFDSFLVYFQTVLYLILTVFMYIFNSKLKKGVLVSKVPYFIIIFLQVYGMVISFLNYTSFALIGILFSIVIILLALFPIINLFKLEPND
ncbi:putative membrane protein [Carnobacterium maltaromaticum LMA28]|uniref:Membrane protein n=1 Tax=Carnobacterium maltaromaticum LMA28 TaxID=1234679 RepID=K8ET64_CARML|nr:hypothetical protein [Carnobacterium maltaromaticum]CCO11781.2 putative membrane protein [Carnobacterium maltaromaticum LMA28]